MAVNLYRKVFDTADKMKKDIDKLVEKIKELKKNKASTSVETIEANMSGLLMKGQHPRDIIGNFENLYSELDTFVISREPMELVKDMIRDIKELNIDKEGFDKLVKNIISNFIIYDGFSKTKGEGPIPNSMKDPINRTYVNKLGLLPGNKALYTYNGKKDFLSNRYKIGNYKDGAEVKEKITFNVQHLN